MALISSTWIFEKQGALYCYWPSYLKSTLSREKTVKNHLPLVKEKCVECQVIVKYHDVNYDKTVWKLRKMEVEESQSELESELDNAPSSGKKSRQVLKKNDYVYYDSDENDEDELPPPPKFPPKKKIANLEPVRELYLSPEPDQNEGSKKNVTTFQQLLQPVPEVQCNLGPSEASSYTQASSRKEGSFTRCCCEKNKNILERILRDITIIKTDLKNLTIRSNNDKVTNNMETLDTELMNFKSYNEIYDFGTKLGNDQEFYNRMLTLLSLLGGKDYQECTRRILGTLLNHELAIKVNWIGANDKGSFQKLPYVLKLIYGAVRRNSMCSNATNSEIDQAIKNWIKNAADREGGRANRKKKQN
ncbi:uncharacterized protein LOC115882241 isoform X3 [Sitophilus oryzae]|nr:uncharacterized protein LOC115882241 isoform X3 [Sitophilus oryzae]XP_030756026.1 uncharacterized protein LOC115882241 isoform X3 [Sitophilus oryzae]XP_030756027.1 uncharacterized protein LOC115882241 isoform X3 [Sitophilus oryzae]XP_030756028.1 uncharacterized protein LOC115882241 isoform X3 [Sitophilus oryzae]XP_030756029.1 uncharacterized protein LOC115882241 isoform X3 [Sitophilus oryzae]